MTTVARGPWRKGVGHEHCAPAQYLNHVGAGCNCGRGAFPDLCAVVRSKRRGAENGERVADIEVWDTVPKRTLCDPDELRIAKVVANLRRIFTEAGVGRSGGMWDAGFSRSEPFLNIRRGIRL
jgi:hypothetical protein